MIAPVLFRLTLASSLLASASVLAAETDSREADSTENVIRSVGGFSRERTEDTLRDPFTLEESRRAPGEAVVQPKVSVPAPAESPLASEIWIYDAATEIFLDLDGDGYYRYLRVRFDADTFYEEAYVYAKLFLSGDGQQWELFFETDDFAINGSSPVDDYEVETELVTGYPSGLYDVLIELYDADYGLLVDEFGPFQSSDFSLLPLEDLDHDSPVPVAVSISHGHGGGGAMSWLLLGGLLLGLWGVRHSRPGCDNH